MLAVTSNGRPIYTNRSIRNNNLSHLDKVFNSFFDNAFVSPQAYTGVSAKVDEKDSAYYLTIDVPGISAEQLDIEVEENILNLKHVVEVLAEVSAETVQESAESAQTQSPQKTQQVVWHKRYRLPEDVEAKNIQAELKLGQLLLSFPKKAVATPVKISINS